MCPIDDLEDLENENEVPAEVPAENEDPIVREDKIFNNKYNSGEGLPDDYEYNTSISVNSDYSSEYLKEVYDYEEQVEYRIIIDRIYEVVKTHAVTAKYVKENISKSPPTKIKLSKNDINVIFVEVLKEMESVKTENRFFNPIYIIEVISSISSLEYRKIFDMLDTEIQQILLIELNKKYQFLDGKMNKKRIH
jgi:hypothetical protein